MIELNTGVPGSGKTLSMVQRLHAIQKRWEQHPEEARPVFVLGIPDLILPHSVVPLRSVQINKAGAPSLVPDWDAMPDGSLVIIDEAQGCFPPRSSASTAPAHVAWLNTHRHKGFDIWITTQHPKLIDATVRALVGKHQHYRRLFGGKRACCYEWDACSDSLSGMNNAVTTLFHYPKNIYKFYKSAEIHTKQNFKMPLWVWLPFIGVALGIFTIPKAYSVLFKPTETLMPVSELSMQESKGTAFAVPAALPASVSSVLPVPQIETAQKVTACVSSATKCRCYDNNAAIVYTDIDECQFLSRNTTNRFSFNDERYIRPSSF